MKPQKSFPIVLVSLLALVGLGLWWFLRPTATGPEKTAATPTPAKIDSVKIVVQPTQVELPKVPPVPAKGTAAALADAADPQADLKTVIPDLARMAHAGDVVGPYETYTPPDKLNPKEIQLLENVQRRIDTPLSASEAARYPLYQQQAQQMHDSAARSWEALETQTPTYNVTGDEATYLYSSPDYPGPSDSFPVTFVKINGKWYQKPTAATGNMTFVGPANTSTK